MGESWRKVETFIVDRLCDHCGKGKMQATGHVLSSYPPQYNHTCSECGYSDTFLHKFPCLRYRTEDDAYEWDAGLL